MPNIMLTNSQCKKIAAQLRAIADKIERGGAHKLAQTLRRRKAGKKAARTRMLRSRARRAAATRRSNSR